MRTLIAIIVASLSICGAALSQPIGTTPSGSFEASNAAVIDATRTRWIIRGPSPEVKWTTEKSTIVLKAAEIVIYLAATPQKKGGLASVNVDKIVLTGGKPRISSDQDGFLLEAEQRITIIVAKDRTAGFLESALGEGKVHLHEVQKQDNSVIDAVADNLEIGEGGDKVVLTGHVTVNADLPAYTGSLAGEVATITGLRKKGTEPADPRIVVESPTASSTLIVNQKPQPPAK